MGFFLTDLAKHLDKNSPSNRLKALKKIKRPKKGTKTILIGFGKFSTPKSQRKPKGGGR